MFDTGIVEKQNTVYVKYMYSVSVGVYHQKWYTVYAFYSLPSENLKSHIYQCVCAFCIAQFHQMKRATASI